LGSLPLHGALPGWIPRLHPPAATWSVGGEGPRRTGDFRPTVVPYQVFRAADGDLFVSAANNRQFRALVTTLGVPELAEDPRFRTNGARHAHREQLVSILAERVASSSRAAIGSAHV